MGVLNASESIDEANNDCKGALKRKMKERKARGEGERKVKVLPQSSLFMLTPYLAEIE